MDELWSILMFLGSAFCHQIPERSYFLGDLQMPLCARCIGLQLGFLLASLFMWTGARKFASGMPDPKVLAVLTILFISGILGAILSYAGLGGSGNLERTISGLLIGIPLPFVVVPLLNGIVFPGRNARVLLRLPEDWAWLAAIFAVGGGAILLSIYIAPLFYIVSILGVADIFVFSFTMLTLLVAILWDKKIMTIKRRASISSLLTILLILLLAAIHNLLLPQI